MLGGMLGGVVVSELCLVEEVVPVGNKSVILFAELCKHCELQITAVFYMWIKLKFMVTAV